MKPLLPICGPVKGDPEAGAILARLLHEPEERYFALSDVEIHNLAAAVVDLERRLREATVCDVPQPAPDVEYEE